MGSMYKVTKVETEQGCFVLPFLLNVVTSIEFIVTVRRWFSSEDSRGGERPETSKLRKILQSFEKQPVASGVANQTGR